VFAGAAGLDPAGAQTKKDTKTKDSKVQPKDKVTTSGATFEMYKDKSGEYRFRLRDGDGGLLAISGKGYEAKSDCQRVIDAIRQSAARAKIDDQAK
jgi:uncharacterized protein YegP (UPF0339 family)